ncbi:hypothetical protein CGCA056_v010991 [Colletotrichum aenigma]|uniref:uncharacterized protein n=1 Tax=Colletotrichum aenigma TaxID=1215731 RepID=UPI0018728FA6|nr:uncharacterized protein CGCA056_v010991 [Colletotrichum aenigma]KAF5518427.1 hypothetical protein CGCA056_v010991 [Colletotrichum aenigma]
MPPVASEVQRLPPELILHVIEGLLPNGRAILPASSSATKTLISFTLVSRSTHELATRLLRERCMHLDSSWRLSLVLLTMSAPRLSTLPFVLPLKCITSLYLSPFGKHLDDQPMALWIRELLCEVCGSLRRLVIDWPMNTLPPWDDHLNVIPTLADGLHRLAKLEELVVLRNYPYLITNWTILKSLRRVVLFGAHVDTFLLWRDIFNCRSLDQVVFVRPAVVEVAYVKEKAQDFLSAATSKRIKVTLANVENEMPEVVTTRWAEYDPENRMTVEKYCIPTSFYGDDDTSTVCCDWVKAAALRGSIWDWEGQPVEAPPMVISPQPNGSD